VESLSVFYNVENTLNFILLDVYREEDLTYPSNIQKSARDREKKRFVEARAREKQRWIKREKKGIASKSAASSGKREIEDREIKIDFRSTDSSRGETRRSPLIKGFLIDPLFLVLSKVRRRS